MIDIIRTSIALSKTLRNAGRLKEIISVFAKNGFTEFISNSGITSKIPDFVFPTSSAKTDIKSKANSVKNVEGQTVTDWGNVVGEQLRKSFEELGPVFIKFGQLLSSREEIFDTSFIDQMKLLKDRVRGVPFNEVKVAIESSLKVPLSSVFDSIDPNPIGTASIGLVYKAILKNSENQSREVVIKVRRPNIIKNIETDLSLLFFIVNQLEKFSNDLKYLGLSRIVEDFAIGLQNELNFFIEAGNRNKFYKNMLIHDSEKIFFIPHIYDQYSREDLLVMEFVNGIPFTNVEEVVNDDQLFSKLDFAAKLIIKTFLQDGFFHADLHGGNFFLIKETDEVTKEIKTRIALIDFGLMGNLNKKGRLNFVAMIYALISFNYENLVYEFLDVAEYHEVPDIGELVNDVRNALSPFIGLSVAQTNFTQLLKVIIQTLNKHKIFLPREWFIIFRALFTLDGVGRSLQYDMNLYQIMERDIKQIVAKSFNRNDLIEEAIWSGRDVLSSLRIIPRHIKWFVRDWSKSNYTIKMKHTELKQEILPLTGSINFLGFVLLSAVFLLSGNLFLSRAPDHLYQIPTITWVFWTLGIFFFAWGLRNKKN